MNIGQAARASGVSVKLIRYYDSIGLLRPATRTAAGYRVYVQQDARMLRLIGCARHVGFTMEQIQRLLRLWEDGDCASVEVKAIAFEHITALNARLEGLCAMRDFLVHLIRHCEDVKRPALPDVGKRNGQLNDRCGRRSDHSAGTRN